MNTYLRFFITAALSVTMTGHCSDQQKKAALQPLTLTQSIVVGGVVGAAEVAFPGQPLSYAMNQAINKQPFVLRNSYKGVKPNALGQMPITAVQSVVQVKGTQWAQEVKGSELSNWQKAGVSYAAGVGGALIDTPSNAMQLYLQSQANAGKSTAQAMRSLGRNCFRGLAPNALAKEGPFAVGYQFLAPQAQDVAKQYVGDNLMASALGGAAAGVVTAVVTQPGAVVRNRMQGEAVAVASRLEGSMVPEMKYKTAWQAARKICNEEGAKGLFKGLMARGTRVAIAVPLYVAYTQALKNQIQEGDSNHRYKE